MNKDKFRNWQTTDGKFTLSQHNNEGWQMRVRSISISKERQELTIEWGLARKTNNNAKELALYQGLKILDPRRI